jgi:hypothetical protein
MSTVTALAADANSWINAIRSALAIPHNTTDRLHFNGRELKWLPKRMPGWFPIAVPVKLLVEAEEESVCAA